MEPHGLSASYVLRKAMSIYGRELAGRHLWVWEVDRWKELVVALLKQVVARSDDDVRDVVARLADLDLLAIPTLAVACAGDGSPDLDQPVTREVLDSLATAGFSRDEGERALTAMCDAASALQGAYDGKVQLYLRRYGEVMLGEVERSFHFRDLSPDQVRRAFTGWLQNALSMPLSLTDADLLAFCEANGISPEQLAAAADEVGLNQAVVDDLTALWAARSAPAAPAD